MAAEDVDDDLDPGEDPEDDDLGVADDDEEAVDPSEPVESDDDDEAEFEEPPSEPMDVPRSEIVRLGLLPDAAVGAKASAFRPSRSDIPSD